MSGTGVLKTSRAGAPPPGDGHVRGVVAACQALSYGHGHRKPGKVREGFLEEEVLMVKLKEKAGIHQVQHGGEGWSNASYLRCITGEGAERRKLVEEAAGGPSLWEE